MDDMRDKVLPLKETDGNRISEFAAGYLRGQVEQQAIDWERVKPLVEALQKIALGSAKPADYRWYNNWGDPSGVDVSNNGDWHTHGFEMGTWEAALIARKALAGGLEVSDAATE